MHCKSLKRKVSKIIRCLSNPLCPNNCQTKKNKGVLHGWPKSNNVIVWMAPFYAQKLLGVEKAKHIIYFCISKTGLFTFENYMRCKSWKCKVSQIIRCLFNFFFSERWPFFFRGFPFTFSTGSTRSLGNKNLESANKIFLTTKSIRADRVRQLPMAPSQKKTWDSKREMCNQEIL